MNAQEAIEFTKYELEEHIFLLKHYESQLPEDDEELIRFKNRGEALSIVLESAKKFHNSHKTEVRAENKLLYYDFSSMINPEELDELGIEKGEDE